MLILGRERDESIMIGDDVEVTVVDIRGQQVRLGTNAPPHVPVHRREIWELRKREGKTVSLIERIDATARALRDLLAQAFPDPAQAQLIIGSGGYSLTAGDKNEIRFSRSHPTDPAALVGAAMDKVEKGEPAKAEVFSPAEYLRDELEARGWTKEAFAHIAEISLSAVDELMSGERRIDWHMAEKLAKALGTSAEAWMNLQRAKESA